MRQVAVSDVLSPLHGRVFTFTELVQLLCDNILHLWWELIVLGIGTTTSMTTEFVWNLESTGCYSLR